MSLAGLRTAPPSAVLLSRGTHRRGGHPHAPGRAPAGTAPRRPFTTTRPRGGPRGPALPGAGAQARPLRSLAAATTPRHRPSRRSAVALASRPSPGAPPAGVPAQARPQSGAGLDGAGWLAHWCRRGALPSPPHSCSPQRCTPPQDLLYTSFTRQWQERMGPGTRQPSDGADRGRCTRQYSCHRHEQYMSRRS